MEYILTIVVIFAVIIPIIVLIVSVAKTSLPLPKICTHYNFFLLKTVTVNSLENFYISEYNQYNKLISNTEIIGPIYTDIDIIRNSSTFYSSDMIVFNTRRSVILYNIINKKYYVYNFVSSSIDIYAVSMQKNRIICTGDDFNNPIIYALIFTGSILILDPSFENQIINDTISTTGFGIITKNNDIIVGSTGFFNNNKNNTYKFNYNGNILIDKSISTPNTLYSGINTSIINNDQTIYQFVVSNDTITSEIRLCIFHYTSDMVLINSKYTKIKGNTLMGGIIKDTDNTFFINTLLTTEPHTSYVIHYSSDFDIINYVKLPTKIHGAVTKTMRLINDNIVLSGGFADITFVDNTKYGAIFSYNKYTLTPNKTFDIPELNNAFYTGIIIQCKKEINVL